MVKFLWPLAMATLVAPMHAAAQIPGPAPALTLRAALALAAQAHPALAAAQYEVQAQDGLLLQASARPNPTLSVEQTGRGGAEAETIFLISQPLELGGKRQARMRAAERGRDGASAALEAQRADLHSAVLAAFFDVLVAQERLRLAQDGNELAQSATLAASRRVAAGKVSPVDETKARLAEANVRLESANASAALASARRRLSAYWTDPVPRFEKAEGDIGTLPELPDSARLGRWREQSPALLPARSEVERRKAVAQLEQANRMPDLTVNLGSKRSGDPARNQAVLGLSIPLPLFDRNQGGTLAAQRQADKAGAELAATASRLENELAQSVQELDAARSALALLRSDILPAAQQASDAARKGFEFGKHSFLDVLDAQRTLLQARAQYLSALSDGHRAAAAIERILGHTANEH
jgi:cobalt-zinc-cadmium efflux system outer membrane protein